MTVSKNCSEKLKKVLSLYCESDGDNFFIIPSSGLYYDLEKIIPELKESERKKCYGILYYINSSLYNLEFM